MYLKSLGLLFVLFSLLDVQADEDGVLQLSDDEFDSSISSFDTSLIMFYAPW